MMIHTGQVDSWLKLKKKGGGGFQDIIISTINCQTVNTVFLNRLSPFREKKKIFIYIQREWWHVNDASRDRHQLNHNYKLHHQVLFLPFLTLLINGNYGNFFFFFKKQRVQLFFFIYIYIFCHYTKFSFFNYISCSMVG